MAIDTAAQLAGFDCVPNFGAHLENDEAAYTGIIDTLQMNIGSMCNQACKHCHIAAGPKRQEKMSKDVMQACLDVFAASDYMKTIDITGGAPEMNPNFEWLLKKASTICSHVIVRTNLTILECEGYEHFAELYRDLGVDLFASLPYYTEKDTDRQRGRGVFESSIRMLNKLNSLGFGVEGGLNLNLVYNPGGAFLPPAQAAIEKEFKKKLYKEYGIEFTNLFAITNNPVGRFGDFLDRSGNIERYMGTLYDAYNSGSEMCMMCRFQISVKYDGSVYDCDFNQTADLPAEGRKTIFDLRDEGVRERKITFANHCYACTAGQGSSCGGATD